MSTEKMNGETPEAESLSETEPLPEGEEMEKTLVEAYRIYQYNVRQTDPMVYRLTKGARGDMPEEELLAMALECLSRCRGPLEE